MRRSRVVVCLERHSTHGNHKRERDEREDPSERDGDPLAVIPVAQPKIGKGFQPRRNSAGPETFEELTSGKADEQ